MDKEFQEKVFKLRNRCTERRLDDTGSDPLDSATLEQSKIVPNLSIGPTMTYNELAAKLDSIIREFR
jgi:hypothetical protein